MEEIGLKSRSLGRTDYDPRDPLTAIRSLMLDSNGLIALAFRKSLIAQGTSMPNSDLEEKVAEKDWSNQWLSSPWCHIESAMAFQLGLPVLIFREKGVIQDGMLEKGTFGVYMPEFDLDKDETGQSYLKSSEFRQLLHEWSSYVRSVARNKGLPPKLY